MRDNPEFDQTGTFCCGRCTLAYWRHFAVADFENKPLLLQKGLLAMHDLRTGDGHWRTLPFFYAIYTLEDLDLELARRELNYAKAAIQKNLKRLRSSPYSKRKVAILYKALEQIA